jgi:hypothetical protein
MRPDFPLHFTASLALLFITRKITGSWRQAVLVTLVLQLGKEAYDYTCKGGDVDAMDFLGDATAYLVCWVALKIKSMKKLQIIAVLLLFGAAKSFSQGFLTTNYVNLVSGSYVLVNQPGGNTTGVRLDSIFNLKFQDEGVSLGTPPIKTLNFVGTGVAATRSGNTATVTIAGGGITSLKGSFSSAIGTGSLPSNYYPYGTPADSLYWLSLYRGSIQMRKTSSSNPVQNDNGLNVHQDWQFIETDLDTLDFDAASYNRAYMEFEDLNAFIAQPTNYSSNNQGEIFMLNLRNMSNTDSHYVHFDPNFYIDFNGQPLERQWIGAGGSQKSYLFIQEWAAEGAYWQLINGAGYNIPKQAISIPHTGFNTPITNGSGVGMFTVPADMAGRAITRVNYRCGTDVTTSAIGVSVSIYTNGTENPGLFSTSLSVGDYSAVATGSQTVSENQLIIIKTGGGLGSCNGLTATLEIE